MADTSAPTVISFKVELTFEAAPGSPCDNFVSGDLLLDGKVTAGRGTVEFRKESTSKDWLVSQLELSVVEKMCQVARRGIDNFIAGSLDFCGNQEQGLSHSPTFYVGGRDLVYPMSLPFSHSGTPNCGFSGQEEPLTSTFADSIAEVSNEFVEESNLAPQMTRQASVGVAFRPTDQELLTLLRDRVESGSGHENVEELPESINAIDPESLLSPTGAGSDEPPTPSSARYFFCARVRAKNGAWSRKTRSGWWDQERNPNSFSTGDDSDDAQKVIFNHKSKGREWTGLKWQMHEYQISKNEPLVLCKVMQVADRPRRKALSGSKREPIPATKSPPEKMRKLHHKRPRVPLQLPTSHSSNLTPEGIPPLEEIRPKEEATLDEEPNFAADLFSLLAPSPRFGKLLAVPSPRADSWIFQMLSQPQQEPGNITPGIEEQGDSAQQSSPGGSPQDSGQSNACVGPCIGCGKTGELRPGSSFCVEGACIICGKTDGSYDAETHLCKSCNENLQKWNESGSSQH